MSIVFKIIVASEFGSIPTKSIARMYVKNMIITAVCIVFRKFLLLVPLSNLSKFCELHKFPLEHHEFKANLIYPSNINNNYVFLHVGTKT